MNVITEQECVFSLHSAVTMRDLYITYNNQTDALINKNIKNTNNVGSDWNHSLVQK